MKLRDYQEETVEALYQAWNSGLKRPAVILPTGMGKTVIFAELIKLAVAAGQKPMVLVHRDELVHQAVEKVLAAAPDAQVGIVKAKQHEVDADVIVASVWTLARPKRLEAVDPDLADLIIVDECHHAAAESYVRVMTHFGCYDAERPVRTAGFTATMRRQDNRKLGNVWEEVVYEKDIMYGIGHEYLLDVRGQQVTVDGLDLASVARSKGDYQDGALGEAMITSGAGEVIADAYLKHARREDGFLRPGILFAPTVACVEAWAQDLIDAGISTEIVLGTTPVEDRKLIYKRVKAGETKVLASCMVLTEGFDLPDVEVAVVARPTSSSALYVQMVGRVLRPAPWTGKTEALVIDVVGVSSKLPLACMKDLTRSVAKPKDGEKLSDAVQRELTEQAQARELAEKIEKERAEARLVDLFHNKGTRWLKTYGGKMFIPLREYVIFLHRSGENSFRICKTGSNYTVKGGEYLLHGKAFPIEVAARMAQSEAARADLSVTRSTARWRSKEPSQSQLNQMAKCRLQVPEMATQGEVSDMLSVHYASRMLDSF